MDTWERDEICLELGEINIECSVKTKRSRSRGNNLSYQTIEIRVRGVLHVKVLMTDVESGFIIDHKSAVGVFHSGMSSKDRIVRLNDCRSYSRGWIDAKFQLAWISFRNRQRDVP